MPQPFYTSWIRTGHALAFATAVTLGAVASSVPAEAQSAPSSLELLERVIADSDGLKGVVMDDMIFPRANFLSYRDSVAGIGSRQLRSSFYNVARWAGGIVYYSFDANLPPAQGTAFLEACQEWEKWVNLKFVERTTQANYIRVYQDSGGGSFSYIGMVGGVQDLSLASWASKWTACHEIAHALGAMHEQCRSDRDSYVSIDFSNVSLESAGNFAIVSTSINKGAYDFDSVMHYYGNAFALNTAQPTIICKPGYTQFQSTMGQRDHLSQLDKEGMVAIYGAPISNYSLSGVVTLGTGKLAGVLIKLNTGQSVTTDSNGAFSFPTLLAGTYTLAANKTGYNFTPTSRSLILSGNVSSVSFAAAVAPAAPAVVVSIPSIAMVENNAGAPYMSFNVSLSEPSAQTVTVNFATVNGSALAGSDYIARSGTLTFRAGTTIAEVRITLLPDRILEANETFSVVLSNPVGATLGVWNGKATIVNDDRASDAPPAAFNPSGPGG